jgi:hypothetical protein
VPSSLRGSYLFQNKPKKIMAIVSQALQRVLAHKRPISPSSKKTESTMEGIYLSKLQLKTLGEKLLSMGSGPDGLCFMIGVGISDDKPCKTVEVIPYKEIDGGENPGSRLIFNNGIFTLNAGGLEANSDRDLIFDSNGQHKQPNGNPPPTMKMAADGQITTSTQKTPPPFA